MPSATAPAGAPTLRAPIFSGPGAKFVLIGIVAVLLLVPTLLVWGLVEDRASRARTVSAEIAQGWGQTQFVSGPWIAIPRDRVVQRGDRSATERDHVFLSPDTLTVDANLTVTERRRSIYSTPLYEMDATLSARFSMPSADALGAFEGLDTSRAFLVVFVSDPSGFVRPVEARLGARTLEMEPGTRDAGSRQFRTSRVRAVPVVTRRATGTTGLHAPVTMSALGAPGGDGVEATFSLALRGSDRVVFATAGRESTIGIAGDWGDPSFGGAFLPAERSVTDAAFSAAWTVPYLARGVGALSANAVGAVPSVDVDLVRPLGFYQIVSRTLKYSIAFIALVFLAVFVLEMLDARRIHFVQYVLVGLALVVFYVLLLALAERIGYDLAYLAGATATTVLVAWYVGTSLARPRGWLWVGGLLAGAYALIWLILNEDEYALLIGAVVAFLAIAGTMFATRNVDWNAPVQPVAR